MQVLPRRCVITGLTQGVRFHRVWVPARSGWSVRMDLPFADMAYRRWNVSWLLFYISIGLACAGFLAGIVIAALGNVVGAVVYLAAVFLPSASWRLLIRGNGPEVVRQHRGAIVLHVPDEEAAREMQSRIDAFEYRQNFLRTAPARLSKLTQAAKPTSAPDTSDLSDASDQSDLSEQSSRS